MWFINFLYEQCIPFAFGLDCISNKSILRLYISDLIYQEIYKRLFNFEPFMFWKEHTYKEKQYTCVYKSLHPFQIFEIIVLNNYVKDLKFYIKSNKEESTKIYVVKNKHIQQLKKFKPKLLLATLCQ